MAALSTGTAGGGGAVPWWWKPEPKGYQAPTSTGIITQDQQYTSGAPAGYQWDPVQRKYVPTVSSATTAQSIQDKLLGAIGGVSGGSGGGSGIAGVGGYPGGGAPVSMPPVSGGGGGPAPAAIPNVAHVDTSAAQGAEFNRAKDRVGQVTSSALSGLRSSLGSRGMLGSGLEERGTASVANAGEGQLGDTIRQQAIDASNQQRQEATTNYEGDITQRGQNIGRETSLAGINSAANTANYQGQVAQRGQDITAQTAANALANQKQMSLATMLQSALSGLSGQLY